jgi:Na+-translocating ferredoxin:NAD+ oxidoreductase subunit G
MSMGMTSAPRAAAKDVPSWRLVSMMTLAGALAGLLIVGTYELTLPRIEHHQAETMAAAVQEVLKAPARYDTLYLHGGALVKRLPAGVDAKKAEKIFLGYDASGKRVGFALSAVGVGFQDPMTVMFGYDAATRQVIAMRVIASKETPGLGDKIVRDTGFVAEFSPVGAPIEGVKKDRATGGKNEVAMITGATVSSRAVIRIINDAVARWQPLMDAYREDPTS